MEYIFAAVLTVVGVILFYVGMSRQRLAQLIEETPTTVSNMISTFGLYEIKGVIEAERTLDTPGTGEPCVFYKVLVEQVVERYGGIGRHRGRQRHWEVTRNEELGVTFNVRDAGGTFPVNPSGAQVDAPKVPIEGQDSLLQFLGLDSMVSGQRISVWSLKPGTEVYVLGEVQPDAGGKNSLGRGHGEYPFVISYQKEHELLRSATAGAWAWMFGGGLAIIVAGLMVALRLSKG